MNDPPPPPSNAADMEVSEVPSSVRDYFVSDQAKCIVGVFIWLCLHNEGRYLRRWGFRSPVFDCMRLEWNTMTVWDILPI